MSNCHKEFLESYRDYPCQDNEGYVPDRGGFKAGFFEAWRIQKELNSGLILKKLAGKKDARIKQLEEALRQISYYTANWMEEESFACLMAVEKAIKALGEDK